MTQKIRIDWAKYFKFVPTIPIETIGDKETGLIRYATTQGAFDQFMEATRGKAISREKQAKFFEYQKVVFLEDEEFYNLDPEYWQELKLVIQEDR